VADGRLAIDPHPRLIGQTHISVAELVPATAAALAVGAGDDVLESLSRNRGGHALRVREAADQLAVEILLGSKHP